MISDSNENKYMEGDKLKSSIQVKDHEMTMEPLNTELISNQEVQEVKKETKSSNSSTEQDFDVFKIKQSSLPLLCPCLEGNKSESLRGLFPFHVFSFHPSSVTFFIVNFLTTHITTLHTTFLLVRTFHQSEASVGSPFRNLNNQFCLLPETMTVLTNQHETFQRVLFSLTRFLGNFSEGYPSHNYFKPNTLNYEILM